MSSLEFKAEQTIEQGEQEKQGDRTPGASPDSLNNCLRAQIGEVLIVAYREDTERLETALQQEGLACSVLRQEDRPDYQNYASIYRCMLNHSNAWARAAKSERPTLIVEADFVPVKGLGDLPMPFDVTQKHVGIAWLYTCAPQLYSVSREGYAEGFSTALVAYILTPGGAAAMGDFVDSITREHGTSYFNFDSEIDTFLRQKQFKNYIPFRNYGEHGGISNPEHRKHGMSGIHRADVLYGPLAFLPDYANGSLAALWEARWQARTKGIGRLVLGKYLRPYVARTSSYTWRLVSFAVRRQLTLRL
jgi:hypothetical protein